MKNEQDFYTRNKRLDRKGRFNNHNWWFKLFKFITRPVAQDQCDSGGEVMLIKCNYWY